MQNEQAKKHRPFVYQRRSDEQIRRRRRVAQFDEDIIAAYGGDTKGLGDYLRSDLPLSRDQREQLAELIYRRIQRKQRGHPPGSTPVRNPARDAERLIAHLVRREISRRYGNRVPRGKLAKLIDEVCEDNAERFEGVAGIDIDNIRRELKRGRKAKSKVKSKVKAKV